MRAALPRLCVYSRMNGMPSILRARRMIASVTATF
jgi:hypothetical protein